MYTSAYLRKGRNGGWKGILKYKDEDGRWRQIEKRLESPSKRAAQSELNAWRADMEALALESSGRKPGQTVLDYLELYISEAAKSVEPSTVTGYRGLAQNVIGPYIGGVELGLLRPDDVSRWQEDVLARYSSASARKALVLLRAAMKQAVERDVLTKDPTRTVRAPKQATPKSNALDGRARGAVITFLDINPTSPVSVGIRIALYTGMRESEICALRWRHVDIASLSLRVEESFGRASKTDAKKYSVTPICYSGLYLKEPKNRGSIRTVCFPKSLADVLKARWARMREECMRAGVPFDAGMYVLGSIEQYSVIREGIEVRDFTPMHPHRLWERWRSVASDLELVGTEGKVPALHDLRHTFATAAIASGIDVKTVSSSMGHADAAMTLNRYASADPDAKRRAAEKLGEVFAAEARDAARPAEILRLDRTGTDGQTTPEEPQPTAEK